jgi:beta-mannosidase
MINDLREPISAELRLRVLDVDGKLLREERKPVTLGAAGVTRFGDFSDTDLLRGADPKRTIAAFELRANDAMLSRGVVYFDAAKNLALADPDLHGEIVPDGDGYRLTMSAHRLARAVWIDFSDLDVEPSDNALTLLPGESVTLSLHSKAGLADLRRNMSLRSLHNH